MNFGKNILKKEKKLVRNEAVKEMECMEEEKCILFLIHRLKF